LEIFEKGTVKNPYDRSVFGAGYIGVGKYKVFENKRTTFYYDVWHGIMQRIYSKKHNDRFPTYKNVTVCEEWHNFQNFAAWYDENYYEVENEVMELDKDILIKGNKIYSPETCIFVPRRINVLFTKRNANRGNLPIGVSWHKRDQIYTAQASKCHLGYFNSIEEAFYAYKIYKENLIKQVANEYKEKIPKKLNNALLSYVVEITD
jgi:hypothetical protein